MEDRPKLIIEINNTEPIELVDLTKALISFSSQFKRYVTEFGTLKEEKEATLYVKEVRKGSTIFEMVELATFGVLPFVENFNTIVAFAEYIKEAFGFILKPKLKKPKEFSILDLKELKDILTPIAKDVDSSLNLKTKVGLQINNTFYISSQDANAAQNILSRQISQLSKPVPEHETQQKQVLTLFQARNSDKNNTVNKGIIEDLSPDAKSLIFEDPQVRSAILHVDGKNPFDCGFVVDVIQQTAKGKVVAYKIKAVHEIIDTD